MDTYLDFFRLERYYKILQQYTIYMKVTVESFL
nr:MAG TPA: hypothetical protein [Bacteriophage sp.]